MLHKRNAIHLPTSIYANNSKSVSIVYYVRIDYLPMCPVGARRCDNNPTHDHHAIQQAVQHRVHRNLCCQLFEWRYVQRNPSQNDAENIFATALAPCDTMYTCARTACQLADAPGIVYTLIRLDFLGCVPFDQSWATAMENLYYRQGVGYGLIALCLAILTLLWEIISSCVQPRSTQTARTMTYVFYLILLS